MNDDRLLRAMAQALWTATNGDFDACPREMRPVLEAVRSAQAAEAGEALSRLIEAGAELSNIAFNLAQRDHLEERERNVLDACRRKWDKAGSDYRAALKGDSQGEQ